MRRMRADGPIHRRSWHMVTSTENLSRRVIRAVHGATRVAVGGGSGDTIVRCHVAGRHLEFLVPGNEVWVCVKDDLLLREYEWLGVDLARPTGTVVDAGAHIGTFTTMAALHADRVVAVEPNPASAALLRGNVARNGLDNVDVIEAALWVDDDGIELHAQSVSSASSVVRGGDTASDTVAVPTVTLAQLVDRYGPVDLLKMDVEGAEFEVLAEASDDVLRQVGTFVGEIHSFLGSSAAVVERLRAAGFVVTLRRGPFFHARESMRQLRTNWSSVHGQRRLKLALALLYPTAAALDHLGPFRERLDYLGLEYLYAVRDGG